MAILCEEEGNEEQSLRCLRLAAEKGHAESQALLGLALENVSDIKAPENEEAFKWMQSATDQGSAIAYYFLGNYYRTGTWVDADGEKAIECYMKAAEQGNSDGVERLGECFATGVGVPVDENVAFQCMERAAAMGNPKAQCNLGLSYLNGTGCRQNTELAFRWISEAVDSGDPAVFRMLELEGLDITKLNGGYKRAQQTWSAATGDWLGENLGQIFGGSQMPIVPIVPGERSGA
jgi:TPR repeat protein